MLSAFVNYDSGMHKLRTKNLSYTLSLVSFYMLALIYLYLSRKCFAVSIFLFMVVTIKQMDIEIITKNQRKYIQLYSQTRTKQVLGILLAIVFIIENLYNSLMFIYNGDRFKKLLGLYSLKLLFFLIIEIALLFLVSLISQKGFSIGIFNQTRKRLEFYRLLKRISYFLLLFSYYVLFPFILKFSWASLIIFLLIGFFIYVVIIKQYIPRWHVKRHTLLVTFETFFILALILSYAIFYNKGDFLNVFVPIVSIYLIYKAYMLLCSIIAYIKISTERAYVSEVKYLVDNFLNDETAQHENFYHKVKLGFDEKTSKKLNLLLKYGKDKSIYMSVKYLRVKIYDILEKIMINKRIIIFVLEITINASIIVSFDFEYNLFGLTALAYFSTSLAFRSTELRLKTLMFSFFPALIFINIQMYGISGLAEDQMNALSKFPFLAIRKNNLSKKTFYFILGILNYVLMLVYKDHQKDKKSKEDFVKIKQKLSNHKHKDILIAIAKFIFHTCNYVFLYYFLNNLYREPTIINLVILLMFLMLTFFGSKDVTKLFQFILVYQSFLFFVM